MQNYNLKFKITIGIALVLLLAAAGAPSYYFYTQYQKTKMLLGNPTEAAKEETKAVTAQLSRLMELPADEDPTIATILDKDKLKDQPFFAKAENGDKVIIYAKSLKAILFRPSANKVIDFAPINIGTPSAQTAQPIRVVLYNGTDIVGLTKAFEKDLKSRATNVEVVRRSDAKKTDYEKTLVVDVTGTKGELAKQMADLIKGDVAILPDGEEAPGQQADLLVIIGKDASGQP